MASTGDDDARRGRRVEAAFRVRYRSVDDLIVALTHDLSRGGLFMRTERYHAIVRVHLELPDGGGEMPVICRVAFVRADAEAAASGKPAGMGVEFLDLGPERLARLERFVAEHAMGAGGAAPRRALDVLVADDDETVRGPVVRALRERGDKVREVTDGLAALAGCLKQAPDVVLSDVQMPRMDGWQLVRMLRARPSLARVPIVLFTTLTDDDSRLQGYRLGVDDFVGKPVREDELLLRVDRVVARTQHDPVRERRSLRGDLEHVTLASVLSFLALEQKTGVLLVAGPASARVHLRGGHPVRVELDDTPVAGIADPALHALLGWTRGQFEFATQDVACPDDLGTTVNALLLEHARRSDERSR
jgi:CheY-like chemotaxis protein/Tfp pilus assembly protein PilZ